MHDPRFFHPHGPYDPDDTYPHEHGDGDTVKGYLLLATACDGTLATTAQFTSVRVVCNNTLQIALGDSAGAVKVPHRSQFDAQAVKRQLGITVSSWDGFTARIQVTDEVAQLARDIAAGRVRATVVDIRRHLGCSQARAVALRRLLVESTH
jgi:hypothetical protein